MRVNINVEPRATDIFAEVSLGVSLFNSRIQHLLAEGKLAADVDISRLNAHRIAANQDALNEEMRIFLQDIPVAKRPRLAFIGVATEIARLDILRDETPFQPGGEAGTASAFQPGIHHHLSDVVRLVFRYRLLKTSVAVVLTKNIEGVDARHIQVFIKNAFFLNHEQDFQDSQDYVSRSITVSLKSDSVLNDNGLQVAGRTRDCPSPSGSLQVIQNLIHLFRCQVFV